MISGGSSWWCVTKLYTSAFTSDFGVFSLHFCLSPRHYSTEIIRIAGQFVFLLFRNDGQSFWNEIFPECAKTFWGPRKKGYKQLPWETEIFFIQPISDLGDNPGWNWTLHGWKGNAWIVVIIALRTAFASKCTLQFLATTWLLSKYVITSLFGGTWTECLEFSLIQFRIGPHEEFNAQTLLFVEN